MPTDDRSRQPPVHIRGSASYHELPAGVVAVDGPNGLRLRGAPESLIEAIDGLRFLGERPDGYEVAIGPWRLVVSEAVPGHYQPRTVSMPADAWRVAASVLCDAVLGEYGELPFDFGEVQYLNPIQNPDIGVDAD